VNGLSIVVDGTAFIARWQAAVGATSYVVECTAQRPPSWTADTSFSISAEAAARDGRNLTVELPAAQVDGLARCRMAAELDGSIGAWSNTANVPVLLIGEPVEEPEVGEPVAEGGPERNPRAPVTPGPTVNPNVPVTPGPVNPNVPVTPGPVNPSRGGASVIPQAAAEIESRAANARNLGASGSDGSPGASGGAAGQGNGRKR
jgi:hypothetical protein